MHDWLTAIASNDRALVEFLVQGGEVSEASLRSGLKVALEHDNLDLVQYMIYRGARVGQSRSDNGEIAAYLAKVRVIEALEHRRESIVAMYAHKVKGTSWSDINQCGLEHEDCVDPVCTMRTDCYTTCDMLIWLFEAMVPEPRDPLSETMYAWEIRGMRPEDLAISARRRMVPGRTNFISFYHELSGNGHCLSIIQLSDNYGVIVHAFGAVHYLLAKMINNYYELAYKIEHGLLVQTDLHLLYDLDSPEFADILSWTGRSAEEIKIGFLQQGTFYWTSFDTEAITQRLNFLDRARSSCES